MHTSSTGICPEASMDATHTMILYSNWWSLILGSPQSYKRAATKLAQPLFQKEIISFYSRQKTNLSLSETDIIASSQTIYHTDILGKIVGNKNWYKTCRNTRNPWRIVSQQSRPLNFWTRSRESIRNQYLQPKKGFSPPAKLALVLNEWLPSHAAKSGDQY